MGTWSTAFYGDDYTCEVRDAYEILIRKGSTHEEAVARLKQTFAPEQDDETGHLFWMVIAKLQWDCGHMTDEVKGRALDALTSQKDAERWEEGSLLQRARRQKVLDDLYSKLTSPQPKPRKMRVPQGYRCPWKVGDLISFRLNAPDRQRDLYDLDMTNYKDKFGLLHVFEIVKDRASSIDDTLFDEIPVYLLYDWIGTEEPTIQTVAHCSILTPCKDIDEFYCFQSGFSESKKLLKYSEVHCVGNTLSFPKETTCWPARWDKNQRPIWTFKHQLRLHFGDN